VGISLTQSTFTLRMIGMVARASRLKDENGVVKVIQEVPFVPKC
jgi:hypothetical protein